MASRSIALIVDSCTDVPAAEIERFGMYVVPLQVNYEDASYLDKVSITSEEVLGRLDQEVPKTSTPTPAVVGEVLERVVADGYSQAVAITISSGLSSTYDLVRSVSAGVPGLTTLMVDSKNIGLGAGLVVLAIAKLIEQGASLEQIARASEGIVADTKVFFCVDTLDYLLRGGRIGKVTHAVGSMLDLRPVISCNEEGVYYTVSKAKGRKKSLKSAMACAEKHAALFGSCTAAVAHAGAPSEMESVRETLKAALPNASAWYSGQVSPALIVHTGPGLIGIAVQGDAWKARLAAGPQAAAATAANALREKAGELAERAEALAEQAEELAEGLAGCAEDVVERAEGLAERAHRFMANRRDR